MRAVFSFILAAQFLAAQNAEQLLDNGLDQFHKSQYAEARKTFEEAARLSPSDARVLTMLAVTRASMGECGPALEELRYQAGRNPNAEIRKLAGLTAIQCLLPLNRFDDILPLLTALRKQYPDDPGVLYESAQVFNHGWGFARAELLRKAPDSYRAAELTAEIQESQGHLDKAIAAFREAIGRNPAALGLHYELGHALLAGSRDPDALDQAREQFQAELNLNPSNAAAEYQIAQIDLKQDKKDDAAAHLGNALAIAPRFTDALLGLGKLRLETGDHDAAIMLFERAVEAQPSLVAAHSNLMLAYQAAGRSRDAQRERKQIGKLRQTGLQPAAE